MAEPWPRLGRRYFNIELEKPQPLAPRATDPQSSFWTDFRQRYPKLQPRPLITSISMERLYRIQKNKVPIDPSNPGKDLRAYYVAAFDDQYDYSADLTRLRTEAADTSSPIVGVGLVIPGKDPDSQRDNEQDNEQISELVNQRGAEQDGILTVDPDLLLGYDPCKSATLTKGQTYRQPAPKGVGSKAVEPVAGADGVGVRFADIERGWDRDHEDLKAHSIVEPLHGENEPDSMAHGTSVLGIVAAVKNDIYCVGIAPKPDAIFVASRHTTHVADAILATLSDGTAETEHLLGTGDVLLLEVQDVHDLGKGEWTNRPVENDHDEVSGSTGPVYEAILLATNSGVTVVEAAGNGNGHGDGEGLDQFVYMDKSNAGTFRDSGAILVAAGERNGTDKDGKCWQKRGSSNYGSRIDSFAQGKGVYTLSYHPDPTRPQCSKAFCATSAASAIVAGVVVSVQGAARAGLGRALTPTEMRDILGDPKNGTSPCYLLNAKTNIGVMPNLKAAIDAALALNSEAPEVVVPETIALPGGTESSSQVVEEEEIDDKDEGVPEQGRRIDVPKRDEGHASTVQAQAPGLPPRRRRRGKTLLGRLLASRTKVDRPWPRDAFLVASKRRRHRRWRP